MKLLIAVIKPAQLDAVKEALSKADVHGMTVTRVEGFGRQKGHTEVYRGAEYVIDFQPKIKLEIAVADAQLDGALAAVKTAAHTGNIGDGKIFVQSLESVVRIRTGEVDNEAI